MNSQTLFKKFQIAARMMARPLYFMTIMSVISLASVGQALAQAKNSSTAGLDNTTLLIIVTLIILIDGGVLFFVFTKKLKKNEEQADRRLSEAYNQQENTAEHSGLSIPLAEMQRLQATIETIKERVCQPTQNALPELGHPEEALDLHQFQTLVVNSIDNQRQNHNQLKNDLQQLTGRMNSLIGALERDKEIHLHTSQLEQKQMKLEKKLENINLVVNHASDLLSFSLTDADDFVPGFKSLLGMPGQKLTLWWTGMAKTVKVINTIHQNILNQRGPVSLIKINETLDLKIFGSLTEPAGDGVVLGPANLQEWLNREINWLRQGTWEEQLRRNIMELKLVRSDTLNHFLFRRAKQAVGGSFLKDLFRADILVRDLIVPAMPDGDDRAKWLQLMYPLQYAAMAAKIACQEAGIYPHPLLLGPIAGNDPRFTEEYVELQISTERPSLADKIGRDPYPSDIRVATDILSWGMNDENGKCLQKSQICYRQY
jgi:hypothetical protein